MFGKVLAQLFGNSDNADVIDANNDGDENKVCEDLYELEDGDWVIINIHENLGLALPRVDSLEDLLIEHPSMSVYKLRRRKGQHVRDTKEKEKCPQRSPPDRHQVPWRSTVWGRLLSPDVNLVHIQKARAHAELKKLTRGALHRKNLVMTRFSTSEKCYSQFKQPLQHVYNY